MKMDIVVVWSVCFLNLPMLMGSPCAQHGETVVRVCSDSKAVSSNIVLDPGTLPSTEFVECRCFLTQNIAEQNLFVSVNGLHGIGDSYYIQEKQMVAGSKQTMKIYNNDNITYISSDLAGNQGLCLNVQVSKKFPGTKNFTIECVAFNEPTHTTTSLTTTTTVPTTAATTTAAIATTTTATESSVTFATRTITLYKNRTLVPILTTPVLLSTRPYISSTPAFNPHSSTLNTASKTPMSTAAESSDNKLVLGMIGAFAAGIVMTLVVGLVFRIRRKSSTTNDNGGNRNTSGLDPQNVNDDNYIHPIQSPPRSIREQQNCTNECASIDPDLGYECVGRIKKLQNEGAVVDMVYENNYMYLNRTDTATNANSNYSSLDTCI